MSTIQDLFQKGRTLLQDVSNPSREAMILLLKSSGITEERFFSAPETKISRSKERQFLRWISKRRSGYPLAYLTGEKEFWSIPFRVSPSVLIPRPETELVVEKALELSSRGEETIVDIGTGCGNIAVSLAKELTQAHIVATDIYQRALNIAKMNASLHDIDQILFVRGSLFSPLRNLDMKKSCDFIVSNPPYVSSGEWEELPEEIKNHEPKRAVVAGKTGLEFIEKLIKGVPVFLKPGGYLIFEIGAGQKKDVLTLFHSHWNKVQCYKDLSQIPRVIVAQVM